MTQSTLDQSAVPQPPTAQPTHLNGIPLAGLEEVVQTLSSAPDAGVVTFETRTRWLGGVRQRTEVDGYTMGGQRVERRHTIECDEPHEIFGSDAAANPQELILAAVASCMADIFAIRAAAEGISLRRLEVHMRGTLDMRGSLELADVPKGFPEVECTILAESDAGTEALEALHAYVQRNSPNFYHLTSAIPARSKLVIAR